MFGTILPSGDLKVSTTITIAINEMMKTGIKFKKFNLFIFLFTELFVSSSILPSSTLMMGFSIIVFSKFIPTIYFGIFTGLAMLLAMISVLTLLPSLILISKPFGK